MNRFWKLIFMCLLVLALFGCAINQPIRYKTSDIKPSNVSQLKNITLRVETFTDNRKSVAENGIVFIKGRETEINDKKICINSEEHYNKEPVAQQITLLLSEHLKQRGAFKEVTVDPKASVDFYLQGSIRQYYSQQDFSVASAVGAQFGLIGALATMHIKTPRIIKIEFTDLKLVDKNGVTVKTLKGINKTFEDEFPVGPSCWEVFWNANFKLKEVIELLTEDVERSLIEIAAQKN